MSAGSITKAASVLLLGNYRPAMVFARALCESGCRVVLGSEGESHGCRFSRFVHETWDHPELSDHDPSFANALRAFLRQRRDITAVVPITEEFVPMEIFALARFGRWEDLLEVPAPPREWRYTTGVWHFGRGLAHAARGDRREAQDELAQLATIQTEKPLAELVFASGSTPAQLLEIATVMPAGVR